MPLDFVGSKTDSLINTPIHQCVFEQRAFDHVNGEKEGDLARMINSCLSWERVMDEISKCAVRCFNCHMKKTARDWGWSKLKDLEISTP
jgi:hypothetical protein